MIYQKCNQPFPKEDVAYLDGKIFCQECFERETYKQYIKRLKEKRKNAK